MIRYGLKICDENGQQEQWSEDVRKAQVLPHIGESYPLNRAGSEAGVNYKVVDIIHSNRVPQEKQKQGKDLCILMMKPIVVLQRVKN